MTNKKLKLSVFSEQDTKFPANTMSVWATEHDVREILPDGRSLDKQPNYVKIASRNPLAKFTVYAKIDCLNEKTKPADGKLWLPRALMHRTWIYDQGMEVDVSYVDVDALPRADVLTVRLNPSEVIYWAEDEVSAATGFFLAKTGIVYQSQMALVKPMTKDCVIGEVISIFPKPKEFNLAYRIDGNTSLVFEGLPDNKQKTIDFSKIGGLGTVIKRLREIIQIPINFPELLQRFGITPPKGMILYGPPGNGKTMIARAVAHSMGASFIEIERSELLSKYVGDSEKNLEAKFREASAKGNSVIFIDEIDSLASARNEKSAEHQVSLIAALLVLMDGINSNHHVFVIGATNRLEAVDPALRRPGRFDLEFEVPLPDLNARLDILRKNVPIDKPGLLEPNVDDHALLMLSELTSGYSGADMAMLYREAAMHAIRRNMTLDGCGKVTLNGTIDEIKLRYDDFLAARREITPTQMRGEQTVSEFTTWDEIVGLDQQKEALQKINERFARCIDSDLLKNRPVCANLLLVGRRGTGKRTLISSFAKKFCYEMMSIDCGELDSLPLAEALQEIHRVIIKCRQSAPSLLLVRNLDDCQSKEVIARKLIGEVSHLSRRLKMIVVLTSEDATRLPTCVRKYKAFEMEISLDIDEEHVFEGFRKMFPGAEFVQSDVSGKTIGQLIRDLHEKILR